MSPESLRGSVADIGSQQDGLTKAISEVSERATTLVREEIELAKAEITQKIERFARGVAVAAAAGVFAFVGLFYLLDALSWGLWKALFGGDNYWAGFLIVAVLLFLLGGISGFLAHKWLKTDPKPKMAIDEAKLIKDTVTSSTNPDGANASADAKKVKP